MGGSHKRRVSRQHLGGITGREEEGGGSSFVGRSDDVDLVLEPLAEERARHPGATEPPGAGTATCSRMTSPSRSTPTQRRAAGRPDRSDTANLPRTYRDSAESAASEPGGKRHHRAKVVGEDADADVGGARAGDVGDLGDGGVHRMPRRHDEDRGGCRRRAKPPPGEHVTMVSARRPSAWRRRPLRARPSPHAGGRPRAGREAPEGR